MNDPKSKPDILLIVFVIGGCFLSAALCPLVSFFMLSYLNMTDYLSLDWASRVQTNSFWFYEVVVILVSLFVLKRSTSKLHRQAAWSALTGALIGIVPGLWINKVAIEGLTVIGP